MKNICLIITTLGLSLLLGMSTCIKTDPAPSNSGNNVTTTPGINNNPPNSDNSEPIYQGKENLTCRVIKFQNSYMSSSTSTKKYNSYAYSYNSSNKLVAISDSANRAGSSNTYEYNSLGQCAKIVSGTSYTVYEYDASGNVSKENDYDNGILAAYGNYTYSNSKISEIKAFNTSNIIFFKRNFEWVGDNLSKDIFINYNASGIEISTATNTYTNYDTALNPEYLISKRYMIPNFLDSRNNYKTKTYNNTAINYPNVLTYDLMYDIKGNLIKKVQNATSSDKGYTNIYAYDSCN